MAARRRVTPSTGNRPLAVLRGRMRSLQREAEALLEQTGGEAPSRRSRQQANQLGEKVGPRRRPESADREGRPERILSGLERELMRRLKSVLDRLDLPSRQELEALDERLVNLERRMDEQLVSQQVANHKTARRKPRSR